jgi:hypothetical protein
VTPIVTIFDDDTPILIDDDEDENVSMGFKKGFVFCLQL